MHINTWKYGTKNDINNQNTIIEFIIVIADMALNTFTGQSKSIIRTLISCLNVRWLLAEAWHHLPLMRVRQPLRAQLNTPSVEIVTVYSKPASRSSFSDRMFRVTAHVQSLDDGWMWWCGRVECLQEMVWLSVELWTLASEHEHRHRQVQIQTETE